MSHGDELRKRRKYGELPTSKLVDEMLSGIAYHRQTAAGCSRIAHAAVEDGGCVEALQQFAGLGAQGRHPNNLERDLHRCWVQFPELFSAPMLLRFL